MPIDPISDYLARQHQAILAGDRALHMVQGCDLEDAIHQTRVAVRRFRSTLRTFAPCFDPEQAQHLDDELLWYAGFLGEVRDRQVLANRLDLLLNDLDESLVIGPVAARIDVELSAQLATHEAVLRARMTTARYRQLLTEIGSVRRRGSGAPILKLSARADRTVTSRLKRTTKTGDPILLHRARKAAKRARYAAELVTPAIGRKKRTDRRGATRYHRISSENITTRSRAPSSFSGSAKRRPPYREKAASRSAYCTNANGAPPTESGARCTVSTLGELVPGEP